jgi:hypothetical protein
MVHVDTDDLIDTQGVAEILGLAYRNTVLQYQQRYADMPDRKICLGRCSTSVRAASSFGSARRSPSGLISKPGPVGVARLVVSLGDRALVAIPFVAGWS